jgi:hypothetical protein
LTYGICPDHLNLKCLIAVWEISKLYNMVDAMLKAQKFITM